MELKGLLNVMVKTFFIVTAGTVLSVAVFCSAFSEDAVFTVAILWQILLLAVLTTLPSLVFFSPKELSKKGWLVRETLHLAVLISILFYLGYIWGWIAASNPRQLALYLFLIIMVYLGVKLLVHQSDKRVANQLNIGLNKYNDIQK